MTDLLLTVAFIAKDEERYIAKALESAQDVADELVVILDSRTCDSTQAIADSFGAKVFIEPFVSFPAQRNLALQRCSGEWVFFLDADERLTPDLQDKLREMKSEWHDSQQRPYAAYWVPRYNRYWNRFLRGGGWYPDDQMRLLLRSKVSYDPARLVHELVQVTGETSRLDAHLEHINIESWAELRHKQHLYAKAEAASLLKTGVRFKPWNIVLQPLREVWRRFYTWNGYRDGALGLFLACVMGYYEFVKYVYVWMFLWQQRHSSKDAR